MSEQDKKHYILPPQSPESPAVLRETRMRKAFFEQAEVVLQNPDKFKKTPIGIKVGLEVECSILDDTYCQAPENLRDEIIARNNTFTDVELGAAQLEWRTDPLDLKEVGLKELEHQLIERDQSILESAKQLGLRILKSGTNPLLQVSDILRTNKLKYKLVPSYHNDNKRAGIDTMMGVKEKVDVRDAAICAIVNSVQCNIEASDVEDAVDKLNRSFAIGPMAVAMSGNARYMEGKDTGISDSRMIAWEISHDTRTLDESERGLLTRIGLTSLYYQDLRDYFSRCATYPFILDIPEAALPIGIGLNWRDTRIKVVGSNNDQSLVVEFRPVSTQPTVKENMALMVFYIGRLLWSQKTQEPLLDLRLIKQNRDEAMTKGLDAELWTQHSEEVAKIPAVQALDIEIQRAKSALVVSGLDENDVNEYLQVLEERLKNKQTPSKVLAQEVSELESSGKTRTESLIMALQKTGALI